MNFTIPFLGFLRSLWQPSERWIIKASDTRCMAIWQELWAEDRHVHSLFEQKVIQMVGLQLERVMYKELQRAYIFTLVHVDMGEGRKAEQ